MSHTHETAHAEHAGHHVPSPLLLVGVFSGLIFLTLVTVGVSYAESEKLIHLGSFSILVALIIAVIKAGLVAMYFMHLRWDSPFNGMILVISLIFVATFIAFLLLDTQQYHYQLSPPASGRVVELGYGR